MDLELAAASLRADGTDVRILVKVLADQLAEALGSRLEVKRSGGTVPEVRRDPVDPDHRRGRPVRRRGRREHAPLHHRAFVGRHPHPEREGGRGRLVEPAARPPSKPKRPTARRSARRSRAWSSEAPHERPTAGPSQGGRPPARGTRARPVHLRPVGQRVPVDQGGRVPSSRVRDGLVDLPHRHPDPEVGTEPGAHQADRRHVRGPGAGHEPHGGGGGRARGRRGGRGAARRQLLRVGQGRRRVHRRGHRGQGGERGVPPQQAREAVHLRPLGPGLLDADADRLPPPGPGHGHLRLPHRPSRARARPSGRPARTWSSPTSPRRSTRHGSWP